MFPECACSLVLATRMVAHFAIEVAAMFPLVPDNDCLKRAYTSIYTIYSVGIYLGIYA